MAGRGEGVVGKPQGASDFIQDLHWLDCTSGRDL